MLRKFPKPIRRIVVKVGSSVVATYKMRPRTARLRSLTEQISKVIDKDIEVVLVTSGAIVVGMGEMKEKNRPKELASLQACAAVGQAVLMKMYNDFFRRSKKKCAQILLTWDDFSSRDRYINARNTINALLERNIVPVVNENDTISTDEIKFGDNDRLAALVASLIHADLLLLLSDVEGLYEIKDGEKKLFQEIKEITREIEGAAFGEGDSKKAFGVDKKNISRGGMKGKLSAVKMATHANVPCIIANGELKDVLLRVLAGERIGTFFMEREDKVLARKHWISFGVKPKGVLTVDEGARKAILENGKSLLLPGVVSAEGDFKKEDIVIVQDKNKQEIARGIINYSSADIKSIADRKGMPEAIHRNNLVLCER
jgi:glutamate 5-kinase